MSATTISVLIPSKGNPVKTSLAIANLVGLAEHPFFLEFIIIVNSDEAALTAYREMAYSFAPMGIRVMVVHSTKSGYLSIPHFYNEGYAVNTGQFIFLYNDDVRIASLHWDTMYSKVLANAPYSVASALVDEMPNPTAWRWAFPMIRRDLCEKIGAVCLYPPIGACDRVIAAYAHQSGRGSCSGVQIRHFFDCDHKGGERKQFYDSLNKNFQQHQREWDAAARAMYRAT